MSAPLFVVGTGRCGSTLISNLLRSHPEVASISELFSFVTDLGCQMAAAFPEGPVTGAAFWTLLSSPWPRQSLMLRHDIAMDEVLYPWKTGGRFNSCSGVPAISQVALPHLTEEPDALFDELEAVVPGFAPAPIGVQYRRLFSWLAQRYHNACWVERSGGSLRVVHRLVEHFPGARFVHIVRDGRDTALSMSRHTGFRMVFVAFQLLETLGVDPFVSTDRRWEHDLPDELAALLPERFTREAFLALETPPSLCGHYWSGELQEGLRTLATLNKEELLTLRYEDFLLEPERACRALIQFVRGEVDEAWVEGACRQIRSPRSSWRSLEAREQARLSAACAPGFEALAPFGLSWSEG